MRSDVTADEAPPTVSIRVGDPHLHATAANALFEHAGLGRPVSNAPPNAQLNLLTMMNVDGVEGVYGASFAASPGQVAQALMMGGQPSHAAFSVASRIVAIEAVFVPPQLRRNTYGKSLVDVIETRARRARADYLVARVDARALRLHSFWQSLGFTLHQRGQLLIVEGVGIPPSDGYINAIKPLVPTPSFAVA